MDIAAKGMKVIAVVLTIVVYVLQCCGPQYCCYWLRLRLLQRLRHAGRGVSLQGLAEGKMVHLLAFHAACMKCREADGASVLLGPYRCSGSQRIVSRSARVRRCLVGLGRVEILFWMACDEQYLMNVIHYFSVAISA